MSEFPTSGKIRFKGKYGSKQGKFTARPYPDGRGGYLGIEEMETEDLEKLFGKKFNDAYGFDVNEETILDLDASKRDRAVWAWLQCCPEIGADDIAAKSNNVILYFVDRPDIKHEKRMKKIKDGNKASNLILDMSDEKRKQLVKYLGEYAEGMSSSELEEFLFNKVETKPEQIINALSDATFKENLLVHALVDAGIIKKQGSGHFKFGDVIVGINMASSIEFLKNPQNRDTVAYMIGKLKKGVVTELASVVDELVKENAGGEKIDA